MTFKQKLRGMLEVYKIIAFIILKWFYIFYYFTGHPLHPAIFVPNMFSCGK